MGVYVNRFCSGCKKSLTDGYVAQYQGVGEPILECASCKTLNSHADRVHEWALMDPGRKTSLMVWLILSTVFWSGALSFVAFVGLVALEDRSGGFRMTDEAMVALTVVVTLLTFGYRGMKLSNMIKESNARMSDPSYVMKLKRLGLA